jgi:hypothetical protein
VARRVANLETLAAIAAEAEKQMDNAFPLVVLAIAALLVGMAVIPPVLRLYRRSRREAFCGSLAALAFAAGAVPIVRIGLFRYMVVEDYRWAIRGPAPFDQLGSGPWWLWTLILGGVSAGLLWGAGFWLLVWARREGVAHATGPADIGA